MGYLGLGVIVDNRLRFDTQINPIIARTFYKI
jgi:hypothetical protein